MAKKVWTSKKNIMFINVSTVHVHDPRWRKHDPDTRPFVIRNEVKGTVALSMTPTSPYKVQHEYSEAEEIRNHPIVTQIWRRRHDRSNSRMRADTWGLPTYWPPGAKYPSWPKEIQRTNQTGKGQVVTRYLPNLYLPILWWLWALLNAQLNILVLQCLTVCYDRVQPISLTCQHVTKDGMQSF